MGEGQLRVFHIFLLRTEAEDVQRKKVGRASRQSLTRRAKNLRLCRVWTLLRTRIDSGVPQHRFLDPTSHREAVGGLASAGRSVGSQRVLHRFVKSHVRSRTPQRSRAIYRASTGTSSGKFATWSIGPAQG